MRILCLYYTHKRGGFCKRLYRLLGALSRAGHDVCYFSLDQVPDSLDPAVNRCRIPFPISTRSGLLFWFLFSLYLPLFGLYVVLRKRPQQILVFNPYYSVMLSFGAFIFRAPITLFVRSSLRSAKSGSSSFKHFFEAQFEKLGCLVASKIVCVSNLIRDQVKTLSLSKSTSVKVLPNDLPTSIQSDAKDNLGRSIRTKFVGEDFEREALVVLTSGVLTKEKNIEFLIRAFSHLNKLGGLNRVALIVAGTGPELESIKKAKEELQCDNVHVLGWVDNIQELLAASDLLVHPSLHEGMPNSILEALAADLMVLASDTPEHREVLGKDELLFRLDEVELAKRLLSLQSTLEERERIREYSRMAAEPYRFDWEMRGIDLILE